MSKELNANYWNSRYQANNIGWDTGVITTPLKEYIDQLSDPSIRILIPGAGNAHEAAYLFDKGFTNVSVCDWASEAISNIQTRIPQMPANQLICSNFFDLDGQYDLILEQTFFCALNPTLRPQYVQKVAQLLQPKGKLVGLLFGVTFPKEGPPFGGSKDEYVSLFDSYFEIKMLDTAHNSIKPRANSELFINFVKK